MMNQRVIFLDIHDEINKVIANLKKTKADRVVFVIPKKAIFFQSVINAKILRTKAEKLEKWIFVVTKEKKGKEMMDMAGIPVFDTLEELEATSVEKVLIPQKKDGLIKIKHHVLDIDETIEQEQERERLENTINWSEIFAKPSKATLFTLVFVTAILFLFVSTLVLPGGTIYLKPERKTLDTVINVTLVSEENLEKTSQFTRKHIILGVPIEATFEKNIDFQTISKVFTGTNAEGKITIVNSVGEQRSLKPSTRFQTKKGVIFRIQDWVTVPPAVNGKNGEVVVNVIADETDIYGNIVGANGNITTPQRLIIPGLPPAGQKILWAEIHDSIGGGTTSWRPEVKEVDIEGAKKAIEEKIMQEAQEDLERYIREKNNAEGTKLSMVPESKFLQKEILEITTDEDILGTSISSFKVYGKIKLNSWAFDEGELLNILHKNLNQNVDPDMYLEDIDPASLAINVFSNDDEEDQLKINVNIKGIETYLIEPETESGIYLVNQIKKEIAGKSVAEAENILINLPEISDVKISVWPFFLRKIPQLPENISIKLWSAQ